MTAVYIASLEPAEEGGFVVEFPDVRGALTEGDTLEEAVANAREALELVLEDILEDGKPLPPASDATKLARKIVKAGAIPVPVEAEVAVPVARVNISIEEPLLRRVDRAASAAGQTRSGFLAEAARAALKKHKANASA